MRRLRSPSTFLAEEWKRSQRSQDGVKVYAF